MVGIAFHVGSNCMDPSIFAEALAAARSLFDFAEGLGFKFNVVDIGGGFPGQNYSNIIEVNRTKFKNNSIHL